MSSEDFKSLIVTDPDLVDEGIDISGLRTTTDTSPYLLGNIPDYQGIQYSTLAPTKYTDLMRLYSQGLPTIDTSQPTTPAPPSGGGGGGGGTSPGTGGGGTTPAQPDSIGGFDPGVVPGPSGFIGLDPEYDLDPRDYVDDYTYSPFTTTPADTSITVEDFSKPFPDFLGRTGERVSYPGDQSGTIKALPTIGDYDDVTTVEGALSKVRPPGFPQDYSVTGALGVDPLEKNDILSGAVTQEDVDNPKGLLDKLGLKGFDPVEALVKTAINAAIGKPVTLFIDILKNLLPPQDPRQTAMSDFYKRDDIGRVAEGELMAGYNPVSGGFLNMITGGRLGEPTQYGLQEAYQDRIDTIENTLADKYKMTAAEIADVKAGSYTGDVDTELFDTLNKLEEEKEKEKGRLDLFSGDVDPSGEGTGDASIAEQIAEADRLGISGDIGVEGEDEGRFTTPTTTFTGVNSFKDIDTGVGEFGTPITTNITSNQIDEFDTTPTINLGPRGLDQDLSTLGDDLSASLGLDKKVNTMDDLDNLYADSGTIMSDATIVDDLPSSPTGTNRPGGNNRDDSPAPSAPTGTNRPGGNNRDDSPSSSPARGGGADMGTVSTGGPPSASPAENAQRAAIQDAARAGMTVNQAKASVGMPANLGDTGGGGGQSNAGKIVCTMMNESYGFGSFRNKIWMKFHKDLSPEYQKGYHKLFLPLVKLAKTNKVVKKVLEHIAVHSTIDMRQATRGKTHLLGRVYRKILLPLCYWVGKNAK